MTICKYDTNNYLYTMKTNLPRVNTMTSNNKSSVPEIPKVCFDDLPNDVKKHIYNEHFEYDLIYNDLSNMLNNANSRNLDVSELSDYFTSKKILDDKNLIYYLRNKNNIFDKLNRKNIKYKIKASSDNIILENKEIYVSYESIEVKIKV